MTRVVQGSALYIRAHRLMGEVLGERTEIRLGEATRALGNADQAEGGENRLGCRVSPTLVSRLLQARRFRKIGLTGWNDLAVDAQRAAPSLSRREAYAAAMMDTYDALRAERQEAA